MFRNIYSMFPNQLIKSPFALLVLILFNISASQVESNPLDGLIGYLFFVLFAINIVFFVFLMQNQQKLKFYDSKSYTPVIWYIVVGVFFFSCFFCPISLIMIIIQHYRIKAILKSYERKSIGTQNIKSQNFYHTSQIQQNNTNIVTQSLPPVLPNTTLEKVTNNEKTYHPSYSESNNVFSEMSQDYNNSYVIKHKEKNVFSEYYFDKDIHGYIELYVNQFDFVNKGDEILKIKIGSGGFNGFINVFSKHRGIIFLKNIKHYSYITLKKDYSFMFIYKDEDSLIKNQLTNELSLKEDLFTKRPLIIGEKFGGQKHGFQFGPFMVQIEYNNGNHRFNILYGGRKFYLYRSHTIIILFENDTLLYLDKFHKPVKYNNELYTEKTYSIINTSEVELLASKDIKKIRIQNSDGTIEQECEPFDDKNGIMKKAFRDYVNNYISLFMSIDPTDYEHKEKKVERNEKKCHVYLMKDTTNMYYKIGISNKPKYREKTLQSEKPTIELMYYKQFPSRKIAESIEKALHNTFRSKRIRGEWFKLDENDIDEIKETLS